MLGVEDIEENDGEHGVRRWGQTSDRCCRRPTIVECMAFLAHRGDPHGGTHIRPLHAS